MTKSVQDVPGATPARLSYSFCTMFDSAYAARGASLIESIRRSGEHSEILVLCLDEAVEELLSPLIEDLNLRLIPLSTLKSKFDALAQTENSRSLIEFYFTCSPFLLKYCQIGKPKGHVTVYLDADLYFYENPSVVIKEMSDASVAIIPHRYPWFIKSLSKKYGTYNVGLLAFRNNTEGDKVLDWWATQCADWCHDYPQKGKYADQAYLSTFASLSNSVTVLENPEFNLAPWNTATHSLGHTSGGFFVEGRPLVFFHFHGLKKSGCRWQSSQVNYLSPMPKPLFHSLYRPYVESIEAWTLRFGHPPTASKPLMRNRTGVAGALKRVAGYSFAAISLLLGQTVPCRRD